MAPVKLIKSTLATHIGFVGAFNSEQESAIAHRGSPLLLLGGAGSGKTTVLIECALARIAQGAHSDSILLLTYGRERASEMRDAIAIRSSATGYEPLSRTFHSLAFSIVRMKSGDDYREPILLSGAEQEKIIADLLQGDSDDGYREWPESLRESKATLGNPILTRGFIRELRDLMMRANERGISPTQLSLRGAQLGEKYWPAASDFWNRYQGVMDLVASGAGDAKARIDPSELINAAIAHLTNNPNLLAQLRKQFATIIVDEFQESDPAQRLLLSLLAGNDLIIALDSKSAVGRFRGADPDGADRAAESLIESTGQKITLTHLYRTPDTRDCTIMASAAEEAQLIAYHCKKAHLIDKIPYSQMAIIVRSGGVTASTIRRACAQVSIPTVGEVEALGTSAAIAPFLLLARIATKPSTMTVAEAEQLLTSEFGGSDPISLRRIRRALLASRADDDLRSGSKMLLDAIVDGEIAIEDNAELIRIHTLLTLARKSIAKPGSTVHDLLWAIWSNALTSDGANLSVSWRDAALRGGSRGAAADRDLDAMIVLFESAARFIERFPGAKPSSFLAEISNEFIAADVITAKGVRPDALEVMTVHSAKGRQWKYVIVAGVQEGIWPNLKIRSTLLGAERLVERERHGDHLPNRELQAITASSLLEDERRLFHVAISRATTNLLVTAVSREDDEPSLFFQEIYEEIHGFSADDPQAKVAVPSRPLTAPALVATLRHELTSDRKIEAAGLLATLATSGISLADPTHWVGSRALSTDRSVVIPGQPVYVSPSGAETFTECGVKWFFEKSGGTNGDGVAQLLGSAIHEFASLKVSNPEITHDELVAKLESSWSLIDQSSGWLSAAALKRAKRMLERFAQYHNETATNTDRTVVGAEMDFEIRFADVIVKGNADRLEVDSDGKYFVVDFKTGKKVIKEKEALSNLQLACYQLGIIMGGFSEKLKSQETSGSHLVYLAHETIKVATRARPVIDADEVRAQLSTIGSGMGAATFIAKVNEMCPRCAVRSSCPVQPHGRSVIE
jgi:superfamily I DNA/RNA helicase